MAEYLERLAQESHHIRGAYDIHESPETSVPYTSPAYSTYVSSFFKKLTRGAFKLGLAAILATTLIPGCGSSQEKSYKQTRIAFVSTRDGNPEIYVMNADGSDVKRLTDNPFCDEQPAWSPDGKRIAFTSDRQGTSDKHGNDKIYVMDIDGNNVRRLTNNPSHDSYPSWSPDGKRIAFVTLRYGSCAGRNFEIHVINTDGTEEKNLTNDINSNYFEYDEYPCESLSWSPDGKRIAFRNSGFDICIMNSDGTEQKILPNLNNTTCSCPSLSPDGKRIAFVTDIGGSYGDVIYTINVDGTEQRRLTNNQCTDNINPSWSPDGKRIAFTSGPSLNSNYRLYGIYVINTDGTGEKRLTNTTAYDGQPSWSPVLEK